MIIEVIKENISDIDASGLKTDRVLMDHYDLTKPHQKVTSESGKVYAISLDEGQQLEPGAVLYRDSESVCYIQLLPEDALVISPKDNLQWARAAFNIGNMHQAAYVSEDCILVAYDAILESVIKKLGVEYERKTCALTGIRANVSAGHAHHHDHGEHHHHHDHHDHKHHNE